jgi:murein DD-endopeptidase MepM/ murein hydrolase activator NlpD
MQHRAWLRSGFFAFTLVAAGLIFALTDVSAAVISQDERPIEHVVEAGETLFQIAQRYNTTVEAIAAANGLADPSRIAVGQILVIPPPDALSASEEGTAGDSAQAQLIGYWVLPGDTLDAVARRFTADPVAVAQFNRVANPARLPAGGLLQIRGQPAARLHPTGQDETAPALALRYDVPLWQFLADNRLSSPGALLPGERILVPAEPVSETLPLPFLAVDVGPLPALQGDTVRVKAELVAGSDIKGTIADETLKFAEESDEHLALFGIHALADSGDYALELLATNSAGDEVYLTRMVTVADSNFGYEEIVLSAERDALLDPVALATERERLEEIKGKFNPERYWDGLFLRPLDTEITSDFGTRRLYQSPSYQSSGYHEGTDFNGQVGTPVFAPAPGVVVLAEELFVRGNALVIDHGWGIYTGYWHLSEFDVQVGQHVSAGEQIARVGNTGLSTGAHLHWDFWVNGTNVRALQWTEYPFP